VTTLIIKYVAVGTWYNIDFMLRVPWFCYKVLVTSIVVVMVVFIACPFIDSPYCCLS
jgi:hypothetical protein